MNWWLSDPLFFSGVYRSHIKRIESTDYELKETNLLVHRGLLKSQLNPRATHKATHMEIKKSQTLMYKGIGI
jgi:hypothetical protein